MRFYTFYAFFALILVQSFADDNVCTADSMDLPTRCTYEKDTGPCRAAHQRFYYDVDSGTCKRFTYGGCRGNENNFRTIKECADVCLNF